MQAVPPACLGGHSPIASVADLERFSKRKRFHRPIAMHLHQSPELREMATAIANCANTLGIQLELPEGAPPRALLAGCRPCGRRLCPFCGWRRSQVWRARLLGGLPEFFTAHPTHQAVFLTLTVRNCRLEELGETLRDIHRAWNRFSRLSFFPTDFWFRRTEITIGRPSFQDDLPTAPERGRQRELQADATEDRNGCRNSSPSLAQLPDLGAGSPVWCHPHVHALLLVPASYFGRGYVRKTEWASQWAMALRADYCPVVDIRRARAKDETGAAGGDWRAATIEAAKYVTKATDLIGLGPQLGEFAHQIHRHRLVAMSTKLRKFVPSHDPTADEIASEIDHSRPQVHPSIPCIAQWAQDRSEYVLTPR